MENIINNPAEEIHVCCLCGQTFVGWGNNPWPCDANEDSRCCDSCNDTKVIPARLAKMFSNEG